MIIVVSIFGVIGLGLLWYVSRMIGATQYFARRADDTTTNPNELREQRKKAMIKRVTMIFTVWMVACLLSMGVVAMIPRVKAVKAALGPSATPTVTNTATPTRTPRPTWTPTRTPTLGTPGTVLSTPGTGTPKVSVTPSQEPTAKIVYQSVVQTQIVVQTKIVQVPVTVIVVVTASPTFTPSPTSQIPATETASPTPTATQTFTETPTETASPTPTSTGVSQ
jgi:hypothetical protein